MILVLFLIVLYLILKIIALYERGIIGDSMINVLQRDKYTNNKIEGIKLDVNIEIKNKIILTLSIGILNTIKDFYNLVEINLSKQNIFVKELKINKIKYERNDERTFSSIGIKENFTCKIDALILDEEKKCIIF